MRGRTLQQREPLPRRLGSDPGAPGWCVAVPRLTLSVWAHEMLTLERIVEPLAGVFCEPSAAPDPTPLELVLLENIPYLVGDDQRLRAFQPMGAAVCTGPEQILTPIHAGLVAGA